MNRRALFSLPAAALAASLVARVPGRATALGVSFNVRDFVAIGDGVTDDTDAILAAIVACSLAGGGSVFFPAGVYRVTSLGTIPDGVNLCGDGIAASVIFCSSTYATLITLGNACSVQGLKFAPAVTRFGFDLNVQGNGVTIRDCYFANYYIAISVGTDGGPLRVGTQVLDCLFNGVPGAGAGCMQWIQFSSGRVEGCVITGTPSGTQPDFGVRVRNGDTLLLSNTNVTRHGHGLLVDTPAARNTYALSAVNCLFDSAGVITGGRRAHAAYIVPGGGVYDTKFANCWFGLSAALHGCLVLPWGSGAVDGLAFTGCEFVDNAGSGLYVNGPAAKNWTVTGGFAGGNGSAGVRAGAATSRFGISGFISGNVAGRGPNDTGILIDAGADHYQVAAIVGGNTTAGLTDNANGANKLVEVVQ